MDHPFPAIHAPYTFGRSGSSLNSSLQSLNSTYSPLPPTETYIPSQSVRGLRRPPPSFRYDTPNALFAGDWGVGNLIALGSFCEDARNSISVIEAYETPTGGDFALRSQALVTMPQTKVAWDPTGVPRLLSSGDTLRLWGHTGADLIPLASFAKRSKSQGTAVPAPLTSFDWSPYAENSVITSAIDTTCTLWDLATQSVTTQLIAHDREVNDVAFLTGGPHQFVSAGADGSARLFDLRALDNSTIIYEYSPDHFRTGSYITPTASSHSAGIDGSVPLLRIAPSPVDQNIVCAFGQEQSHAVVLDIRATRNPIAVLDGHQAPINSIKWMPMSRNMVATGGDDCQLLMWDVSRAAFVALYSEFQPVNGVLASKDGQWLGSINGKSLQAVSSHVI